MRKADYVTEGVSFARAAIPEWRAGMLALGGQCFVVQEVPGSNPGGTSFFDPSLSEEKV